MTEPDSMRPSTGTTRAEISFTSELTGRELHINTAETRRDNVTPTRREREAARRLYQNGSAANIIILVPKRPDTEHVHDEAFEDFMQPLMAELDRPPRANDARDGAAEFPWYEYVPPGSENRDGRTSQEQIDSDPDIHFIGITRYDRCLTSEETGRTLYINAVSTRRDHVTPTRRERAMARRLVDSGEPGDIVVLLPKPPSGQQVDYKAFEADLKPLLIELCRPAPANDGRGDEREFPWFEWIPPD